VVLLLALAAIASQAPPDRFPWQVGGRIEASDPVHPEHEQHYDDYRVRLTAGTRYRFTADSPGGQPYGIMLWVMRRGEAEPLFSNMGAGSGADQQLGGPNARLTYIADRTADYVLRVLGSTAGERQPEPQPPYTLRVAVMAPEPAPVPLSAGRAEASTWRVWEGTLTPDDPDDATNRHYDNYLIPLTAGRTVMMTIERTDFPPGERHWGLAVEIDRPGRLEAYPSWSAPSEEEAPLGGGGPVVRFSPDRTGDYVVRIISNDDRGDGPYRLRISEQQP